MRASISSITIGLVTESTAPASSPRAMCSVSASPVMKITGTLARPASRLRRRQVSNPSMPGITASSSTMSGVIWSTMRIAAAPSSATITVIPALSSASVSSRSVSGESSTTSATSRFFDSVLIRMQRLQCGHVLVEIEAVDQRPHFRDEVGMFRMLAADLVQLQLDALDVADLTEPDQRLDVPYRRPRATLRLPQRHSELVRAILPFKLKELTDCFQEARNVDWLHQIAVVEGLRQRRAVSLERAGRHHQDACLMMTVRAQRLRDGPAVHARHGDVEQEQVRPAMLRQREASGTVGRAEQDEAERR